jgi:tetratricopeptide (TPR) repeat protein
MAHRNKDQRDQNERREDALRPNPYLGYDRDALGMHLFSREAYEIALTQFRRAVWLNPFEPEFKKHLAHCLYKLGRYSEALQWLSKLPDSEKTDEGSHTLLKLIEDKLKLDGSKGNLCRKIK